MYPYITVRWRDVIQISLDYNNDNILIIISRKQYYGEVKIINGEGKPR